LREDFKHLRAGAVELVPGQHAVVRVGVATLWSEPSAARPVDSPAVAVPSDVRTWVDGLTTNERIYEGVLTQLLLGERVLVEEVRDGWVRGVALDQPAGKLDPRGYPGWLPAAQLALDSTVDGDAYIVDAPATLFADVPGGPPCVTGVVMGTRLLAADTARDGWLPVHVPGGVAPLWTPTQDLVSAPAGAPQAADVLAVARRLLHVTYVWGGLSPYGIDCSALVHLAWRRFGVTVPRDADDQFRATQPVPLRDERPGDLYFFARNGAAVHHVGFVAEPPAEERHMVHACYTNRRVIAEPVRGDRAATLVAAHRVIT
jgi:hypothetical protein